MGGACSYEHLLGAEAFYDFAACSALVYFRNFRAREPAGTSCEICLGPFSRDVRNRDWDPELKGMNFKKINVEGMLRKCADGCCGGYMGLTFGGA